MVALKILKPEIAGNPQILERFKSELPSRGRPRRPPDGIVRTDATADSLAIMLEQLRRLCDEPIPSDELDRAKSNAVGTFALRLEQPLQVVTKSYLRRRYGFSVDYWERYPAKVNSVSAAEIQAVAQKYLAVEQAQIVAVGDAARIRPALDKPGKVEA